MAKLVSNIYGDALFELALEQNKIDSLSEEIAVVLTVLAENQDLSKLMNHPKILKEEKLTVLNNVFKGRVSDELKGFLHLIVSKDRPKPSTRLDIARYIITSGVFGIVPWDCITPR